MARKRRRSREDNIELPGIGEASGEAGIGTEDAATEAAKPVEDKKTVAKAAVPAKATAKKGPSAGDKIATFLKDVRAELKKVSWPDRERTTQSTGVVIFTLFSLALVMTAFTLLFTEVAKYFFG